MARHFLLTAIASIFVTLLILSPPTAANSPVLDMDGNPLEVGSQYHVLTAGWGGAGRGGLTSAPRLPRLCPTFVAQHQSWLQDGRPVSFYPSDSSQTQITQGDDVNIAFNGPNVCRDSGVWKLTFNDKTEVPYIATNGVVGNPGPDTVGNWFRIEKAFGEDDFAYKILYCFEKAVPFPGITVGEEKECQQLDATHRGPNGVSFLSLVDRHQNLPFFGYVFRKVSATSTINAF